MIVDSYSERCWALITPPKTAPPTCQQSLLCLLKSPHSKLPHLGKVYCLSLPPTTASAPEAQEDTCKSPISNPPPHPGFLAQPLFGQGGPRTCSSLDAFPATTAAAPETELWVSCLASGPQRTLSFPVGYSLCPTVAKFGLLVWMRENILQ